MLALLTLTIFLSSALLFAVQPMFAKLVLPRLGGSPAVWNTCMLFFQSALLCGYAYAHVATQKLRPQRQLLVHGAVLLLPLATLPIAVPSWWTPPTTQSPLWSLLTLSTVSVGLPFFVVSTTGPLLQRWFSLTSHAQGRDPYFLYAASNAGSMLALLAYPLLFEPALTLEQQSHAWTATYVAFVALTFAAAVAVWRGLPQEKPSPSSTAHSPPMGAARVSPLRRLHWLALAFVPSSAMLGVTTFTTTDIAAFPLLWVVPLALYLLSFSLVFSARLRPSRSVLTRVLPGVVLLVVALIRMGATGPLSVLLPLHLAAFFLVALVCHGELARDRPDASLLTDFYLTLSVGGALGGVFNAIVSPAIFWNVLEYPLALLLGLALCPRRPDALPPSKSDRSVGALFLALCVALSFGFAHASQAGDPRADWLSVWLPAAIAYFTVRRPRRFFYCVSALWLAGLIAPAAAGQIVHSQRSFFGVHRVARDTALRQHVLFHGTTAHGRQHFDAQSLAPTQPTVALTYYHRQGPAGDWMRGLLAKGPADVAIVGLGAGSLAAYARPNDRFVYFEIDPFVQRIAEDTRYFTYIDAARARGAKVDVVLGDARLTLARVPDASYDALVLDAFSSDSIPVHLLTVEALALYQSKLRPDALLAFHVSNRHLDVLSVVAASAQARGLAGLYILETTAPADDGTSASTWAVLESDATRLRARVSRDDWLALGNLASRPAWTDDHSDVWSVLHLSDETAPAR
jgi:hypothetical protein